MQKEPEVVPLQVKLYPTPKFGSAGHCGRGVGAVQFGRVPTFHCGDPLALRIQVILTGWGFVEFAQRT